MRYRKHKRSIFPSPKVFPPQTEASEFSKSTGTPATLAYAVGLAYLGLVVLTAYPGGAIRIIPFTVHGTIEFITAFALIASPWALGFAGDTTARNLFVAMGAMLFVVWMVSDYRAADAAQYGSHAAHR